jgi:protein ImuA
MKPQAEKIEIAKRLQAEINVMQGLGQPTPESHNSGLAPFADAFSGNTFPTGTIHEFISYEPAHAAATSGFISALTGKLIQEGGICLWVSSRNKVFPFGLTQFGLQPDRVVFINTRLTKEALWVIEEGLKCEAFTAVIGEIKELSFTDSRRLQLAVERSGVTGFMHRHCPKAENAVACTTRWKITPVPGFFEDGLPGVAHNFWNVQLIKIRNGRPHSWQVNWSGRSFVPLAGNPFMIPSSTERYTG